jgi:putative Ca2+/H+ antiporter (TMEM165/GDT1 family)
MDPLSFRFRYFLAIVFAAVVIAAALRHIIHVYVGLSREEIRTDALIAIPFVAALAIILFQRKRQP